MTPPPAAAQRAISARPTRANPKVAQKRPSLRVLDAPPRRRGRALRRLAALMLIGSLLAVVVAHSMLAEGEVRLTAAQGQVAAEQALHRQLLASVAQKENPQRIIVEAKRLTNLVPPGTVTQLPAVPLNTPIGQSTTTPTVPPSSSVPSATSSASTAAAGHSASAGR